MMLEINMTFSYYLLKMGNICGLDVCTKECGDIFEAIIGSLFYYYYYESMDYNIINKIHSWLKTYTSYEKHIRYILDNKILNFKDDNFAKDLRDMCKTKKDYSDTNNKIQKLKSDQKKQLKKIQQEQQKMINNR
jgi:hypothetical protein